MTKAIALFVISVALLAQDKVEPFTATYRMNIYHPIHQESEGVTIRYANGNILQLDQLPFDHDYFRSYYWEKTPKTFSSGFSFIRAILAYPANDGLNSLKNVSFPSCAYLARDYNAEGTQTIATRETSVYARTTGDRVNRVWVLPSLDCLVVKEQETRDGQTATLREMKDFIPGEPDSKYLQLLEGFQALSPVQLDAKFNLTFPQRQGEFDASHLETEYWKAWDKAERRPPRQMTNGATAP